METPWKTRRGNALQRFWQSLYEQAVPAVIMAIPEQAKHELVRKRPGSQPNKTLLQEPEEQMDARDGLRKLQQDSSHNNGLYRWILQRAKTAQI